jgi:hypothetical protein
MSEKVNESMAGWLDFRREREREIPGGGEGEMEAWKDIIKQREEETRRASKWKRKNSFALREYEKMNE